MKHNDIIFFDNELFVVVEETHVNVLDDPIPHKGIKVRKPLSHGITRIILDTDYALITTLAMR